MGLAESVCDVRADSWMSSQQITKHFVTSFGSPAQLAGNQQNWLTAKQPSPFTGCAPSAAALPRKKTVTGFKIYGEIQATTTHHGQPTPLTAVALAPAGRHVKCSTAPASARLAAAPPLQPAAPAAPAAPLQATLPHHATQTMPTMLAPPPAMAVAPLSL